MDSQAKFTLLQKLYREVGGNPDEIDIITKDKAFIIKKKKNDREAQILDSEIDDELENGIFLRLKGKLRQVVQI